MEAETGLKQFGWEWDMESAAKVQRRVISALGTAVGGL